MNRSETESFPADVARELKTYVYRLIDPRNEETFYVGKGRGDRVFAHIRAVQGWTAMISTTRLGASGKYVWPA